MTPENCLARYLGEARWFGGKGRPFAVTEVHDVPLTEDDAGGGLPVITTLVTVTYEDADAADASATDVYQVPIARYNATQERLAHAFIGEWDGSFHYDALHDRESMQGWLAAFAQARTEAPYGGFHRAAEHELDLESHSTLLSVEQSNSSVAFGEDALMKVFRRVTSGRNPDIEIHAALTRAGSEHVAALYGYVAHDDLDLAMLQQFLRTASDGWELARVSARNLFAEGDLHADEVGGDFAAEAQRLGVAVAEVHALLAEQFGTDRLDLDATVDGMRRRLDAAVEVVPELAAHHAALARVFDGVREVGVGQAVQRIHGDLHLGQTLRTSLGWKLVDFEGEPAKPLSDRQRPDSPWRDVAGMLRSFDYAARAVARDIASADEEAAQIAYRTEEWVSRNTQAFLDGYVEERGRPLTETEQTLVTAWVVDKAVYEAVYEARNRPAWLEIPLVALERIASDGTLTPTRGTEPR